MCCSINVSWTVVYVFMDSGVSVSCTMVQCIICSSVNVSYSDVSVSYSDISVLCTVVSVYHVQWY